MPWASEAQRRKFYATPSLRRYIPEFNAATPKGEKLPEHAGSPVTHALKKHHKHRHRRHHR